MIEKTYLFEDYEVFVNIDEETKEIIDVYTWADDINSNDYNILKPEEWEKGKNPVFKHAKKPKEMFEKEIKHWHNIDDE